MLLVSKNQSHYEKYATFWLEKWVENFPSVHPSTSVPFRNLRSGRTVWGKLGSAILSSVRPERRRETPKSKDEWKKMAANIFRDLKNLSLVLLFLITPLYAQNFGALVEELSGAEDEQVESEMPPPELPKAEEKILMPSSNEIQAVELENPSEEDDFAPVKNIVTNGVTLQGLDKQTARVFIIDARVGQPIEFGTLRLVVQHCEKAPLENHQESMAFIRITEQKVNSDPQNLFSGWMFSSSPALSALDHPIYDVWVKECKVLD